MSWIEGERFAFGLYEAPAGSEESQTESGHELFIYVLSGELDAQSDGVRKSLRAGDIVHVPRGGGYGLTVKSSFARYAVVRSTEYLEHRIESMTPAEAEQARVSVQPN